MIDTAKPYINVPMRCDPYNVSRWYADEAAVALRDEFEKQQLMDYTDYTAYCNKWNLTKKYDDPSQNYIVFSYLSPTFLPR